MELDNFWAWVVAVLVVGTLVADAWHDVRRLVRARSVVLIGILAWFLLEGITLSPGLKEFDQATYDYSVFCVFLATAAFLGGYYLMPQTGIFEPAARRFRCLDSPELLWRVVMVCLVLGFTPIVYYSGLRIVALIDGIMGMRSTWGGLIGRGRYGGFREAMLMLECFLIGAAPLALILTLDRRLPVGRRLVSSLVVIWPLMRAYGSGTRTSLITAVLPMLALVYFKSTRRVQQSLIVACLIMMPLVYYFMASMVASRNAGQFQWGTNEDLDYVGSEMLQELAYIVANVPDRVEYQHGYGYYVQLVNPVPRFLWPGKPTLDSGILIAQLKGAVDKAGEAYMTISPGLIGEMYLNFGLMGVIGLSALGGWLARCWDGLIELHRDSLCTMIFYSMGLSVLFILGRSFTMNMFYAMLFLYLSVWFVIRWAGIRPTAIVAVHADNATDVSVTPARTLPGTARL